MKQRIPESGDKREVLIAEITAVFNGVGKETA